MRIALVYAPPWKIPLRGEAPDPVDGPPGDIQPGDLDPDFFQIPYGLLSLAAQALRAGHRVKVLNLAGFAWRHVAGVVAALDADLWGLSCWTANRRGVALVAREIRARHPRAHVVVGGPHATPLAREMLAHHPEIDTVATGEGDATFLELIARLEAGRGTAGLAGAWYRAGGTIVEGPPRDNVRDLDELASPFDYFDTHILMTSRGCPWQCTFCGADTTWGRGFRANSTGYVLDELARVLPRLPVKMIQIKDDTFTTNKKRVIELCRGIRARGLNFLWSCDTRVDVLSDELLREMRLAGCQRMSLGVESGSPKVLAAIDKKITVDEIVASTELAKKYGIRVRYYMMVGNRGEGWPEFEETLRFLERARPHEYLFSCLSVYPGTRDFHDAEAAGWLDREVYFTGDFQEFKVPFDASEEDGARMARWFEANKGLRVMHRPGVDELRDVLARLGDHAPAHAELASALLEAGAFDAAEGHLRRALDLAHPLPGLVWNLLAVAAARRGDLDEALERLHRGVAVDPQHPTLLSNHERATRWLAAGGAASGEQLTLAASDAFQLLERTAQPTLPGPLPQDFAVWEEPVGPTARRPIAPGDPGALSRERRRLAVLKG
jgi:anaerobic magnesium-protoporphyrin IX monomethyl ester cyclase